MLIIGASRSFIRVARSALVCSTYEPYHPYLFRGAWFSSPVVLVGSLLAWLVLSILPAAWLAGNSTHEPRQHDLAQTNERHRPGTRIYRDDTH